MRATLLTMAGLMTLSGFAACDVDYVHNPNAYFPADYETSYTQVADCAKSSPHGNTFVLVYASPDAKPTFDAASYPYPQGSVFVKPQYDDSACTSLVAITAMRKGPPGTQPDNGDWEWQRILDTGDIDFQGADQPSCYNCHSGTSGTDFVYTTSGS